MILFSASYSCCCLVVSSIRSMNLSFHQLTAMMRMTPTQQQQQMRKTTAKNLTPASTAQGP
jgi:hypothetical protein